LVKHERAVLGTELFSHLFRFRGDYHAFDRFHWLFASGNAFRTTRWAFCRRK
jgi:hypothetical protein